MHPNRSSYHHLGHLGNRSADPADLADSAEVRRIPMEPSREHTWALLELIATKEIGDVQSRTQGPAQFSLEMPSHNMKTRVWGKVAHQHVSSGTMHRRDYTVNLSQGGSPEPHDNSDL